MKRTFTVGAAALAFLLGVSAAHAQYNPFARPGALGPPAGPYVRPLTVSPYLNLLGTSNAAVNYYLRVLPEFDRRVREGQLESSLYNLEQRTTPPTTSEIEAALRNLRLSEPLGETGHAVRFGDASPYFPQQRAPGRR